MFKVNQKVWCAIYGAGVVARIRQETEVAYPVVVVFKNNGDENVVTYTSEGKYHEAGNITLFPYPIEITKAVTKPSIDWSHVSSEYNYLVKDSDGEGYLCGEEPSRVKSGWNAGSPNTSAEHFASFIPGTCDWRDSLVKRPN